MTDLPEAGPDGQTPPLLTDAAPGLPTAEPTTEPTTEATTEPMTEAVEPIAGAAADPSAPGAQPPARSRREVKAGQLEQEGDIAADYLEGLLDIADLDGDIDMDVEGERALVSIVGGDLRDLVGKQGQVLEALQELTRLAVQAQTGDRSRLMLDVEGYRAARRTELTALGSTAAKEAAATGAPVRLAVMSAFERKVVHDAVAAAGLRSESEGDEPSRRVVVLPAG